MDGLKHRIAPLVVGLAALCGCGKPRPNGPVVVDGPDQSPSPLAATGSQGCQAVSLRILSQKLAAGPSPSDPAGLLRLCGLRNLIAVVRDSENDDILLVGSTSGPTPLLTEDFCVALRCAYGLYGERRGNTIYVTAPAISIDPDPAVMQSLDQVVQAHPDGGPALLSEYRRVGESSQAVRVYGMPHSCHVASVAVACDYNLKRITNGSVPSSVSGLKSLFDLRAEPSRKDPFGAQHNAAPSMDRFWFTPGRPSVSFEDDVAVLNSAPVRLRTEAQYLNGGQIVGTGRANGLAERWVSEFTSRFDDVAANDSRYAELAQLYRDFALANEVHRRDSEFGGAAVLQFLLNDFVVPPVDVPSQLPGLTRVEESRPERATAHGKEIAYWCHTSCGGVNLGDPSQPCDARHDRATLRFADACLSSRPSAGSLSWTVPSAG